jgi:hypothetical protein
MNGDVTAAQRQQKRSTDPHCTNLPQAILALRNRIERGTVSLAQSTR